VGVAIFIGTIYNEEKERDGMRKIDTLKKWLAESKRIVFLGGAGVSTESGIPDFRGVDGLYKQKFEYPPETIISYDFFLQNPEYFFYFYREKMMPIGYEPNITHRKLAQWEKDGKLLAVVTQNIDGLHQKAGSKRVYELHGTLQRNYCLRCGEVYPAEYVKNSTGVPKCSCGGTVRPDIVMYQERLDPEVLENSAAAMEQADLVIVGGTSLTVYPAAGLINYYRGNRLVLINRDVTPYDHRADLVFHESLGQIFGQL
jgi:NAD-dependent deacetylase